MIILDVWGVAVFAACLLIGRAHDGELGWAAARIAAAIACATVIGESLMLGRPATLTTAALLIAPALVSVFIILPYLTVAVLVSLVGPRITTRLRGGRIWIASLFGWAVWTLTLTPIIASYVVR